ncbi:sister chromatid cohesion 1 protein 4-like [Iris pallida]|uniref:Sister chromatid cohesion 1 protein 4-like n=1 Tax=Iris pallida TaxID=29817 RepID=A0AAX6IBN9_IRIPA|nr:sister chromatid cohesion 1 protein 4-like [Iris pallida]
MFYSQFILAKKGPLGTIWIAAHLERKLRKNQVADTDIGVSVDSILFPDVPIALRLSSHLLLGVVRIYSRKVNYLFHDCSEALLKIKQAFRSTAVDLPPEESTAPYHSITLPETFDLDDFELPDTAFLNGHFVDHHVSTREQITLQDTLDGTEYSTSQFGLDERFGDGDASQIGLELDEELFMDGSLAFQRGSVPLASEEGLVHQEDVTTYPNEMDIEQNQYGHSEYRHHETSNDLSEVLGNDRGKHVVSYVNMNRDGDPSHRLVYNIQTPDLNEVFRPDDYIGGPSTVPSAIDTDLAADDPPSPEFMESSHAPSTPGLLDEAIPANVQECSALSSRDKISPSVIFQDNKLHTSINEEVGCPDATTNNTLMHASPTYPVLANFSQMVSPTSVLTEPNPDSVAPRSAADNLTSPDEGNGNFHIHEVPMHPDSVNSVQLSSSALLLSNQNHHSLASQCSVGLLAAPGTISATDVMQAESANPLVTNTSQMVTSPTLVSDEPIPDSLASHSLEGMLAAPDVAHVESTAKGTENLHTVPIFNEGNHVSISNQVYDKGETTLTYVTPDMPTDKPAVASVINGNSFMDTPGTSNTGNQDHVKDAQSCLSSNLSTSLSEFLLRSCSTHLNQTDVLSLEDMVSAKTTPGVSFGEVAGTLNMPTMEKSLHHKGSSVELQGEFPLQKSTCISSELNFGVNAPVESSGNCISELAQTDPWNCTSSSQFPDPEKMLLAPTGYSNLPSDLGQQTADKGVTESDGSVDRISNLSGQKRHFDNTPGLQNGMSVQVPGIPRKRRYNNYIPEDDDLLASILVGRRTPAFTTGPTPPVSKANSLKRPRLTSRVVMTKRRKVLQDDTMVLHADAIRQQLVNTEDIRRLRKKAPCTRPEIWRIQKSLLEDDIFSEAIFTDISAELNSLLAKRYILDQNVRSKIDEHIIGSSKNVEVSRSSEIVRETTEREMTVQSSALPGRVDDRMQGLFGTTMPIHAQGCNDAIAIEAHQQFEYSLPSVQAELLGNNQAALVSTGEVYVNESAGVELDTNPLQHIGNESEIPIDSMTISTTEVYVHENRGVELATISSVHSGDEREIPNYSRVGEIGDEHDDGCFNPELNDDTTLRAEDDAYNNTNPTSIVVQDSSADMFHVRSSDYPINGHADPCKTEEVGTLVSVPNNCILEVAANMPVDISTGTVHADSSMPEAVIVSGEPPEMAVTDDYQTEASKAARVTSGEESVKDKLLIDEDEERPTSEVHCTEGPDMPPCPVPVTLETEHVPSAVGENSCMQEFNLDCGLVVESSPMDVAAARESSDFSSAVDDLDTEFLNVDDGMDYDEEADNDLPNPESQTLENSGWSSRTRGVARYLKTIFDEESGRGRKSVAIDHLLAGKTRKEASRMFFETLVLKTRDYIHVEQETPFDNISIKPRTKILKSEF